MRAGVFMFYDLVMAGLGVCRIEDIALSVLTSVIGHQNDKGWIITDAGWMALSRDRGTAAQAIDQGYGLVCDVAGRALGNLVIAGASQEHGIIADRAGKASEMPSLAVGDLLRILPNHACMTAAAYPAYHVVEGSTEVVDLWDRVNGWY